MTLAAYTGHEALTFQDYIDQETGRTLTAEPGRSYDVAPASGHLVPDIPAGWFTPADPEVRAAEQDGGRPAAESAAAEDGTGEGAGPVPGDPGEPADDAFEQDAGGGEPQQF